MHKVINTFPSLNSAHGSLSPDPLQMILKIDLNDNRQQILLSECKHLTHCFLFRRNTFRLCSSYIAIQNENEDARKWSSEPKDLNSLLLLFVVLLCGAPKKASNHI